MSGPGRVRGAVRVRPGGVAGCPGPWAVRPRPRAGPWAVRPPGRRGRTPGPAPIAYGPRRWPPGRPGRRTGPWAGGPAPPPRRPGGAGRGSRRGTAGGAGGREEPGDGLADGDVGGPLPRQGDEQLQAARPVRCGGRGVGEGVEQRATAGVEDRGDVLRRKRVVGQGQGEERADVRFGREVPAPVQSAQTGQHGSGEQEGSVAARATRRPTSVRSARSPRSSTACPRRAGVPAGSSAVLHSTVG